MPDLHVKYRPTSFDGVVGQDPVIRSLSALFEAERVPHSFLFTGPSGVGKTTLARIIASRLDAEDGLIEIDAATHTGIDAMRGILEALKYKSFGKGKTKVLVVDECHSLSKQAWQSLLKAIEEPPTHVYWVFCTTEVSKVPATIKTRSHSYDLLPVPAREIEKVVVRIAKKEGFASKLDESDYETIARQSYGSVRQAIVYLSMVSGGLGNIEVKQILKSAVEESEVIDLCRLLVSGKLTWLKIVKCLQTMKEQNAETIRLVIVNYMTKVALGTTSEEKSVYILEVLSAFSEPCRQGEGLAPILLAFGSLVFLEE